MTRRRFVTETSKPVAPIAHTLAAHLTGERLPLDLALSLAVEIVDAVATAHQRQRAFGHLSAADFVVQADGSIGVIAPSVPGADNPTDTYAVGAVLYQVFTGLTPAQARARLQVSPLHAVPPASLLNPALDDSIEELLARLLDKDAARRPHSVRVVEAMLADVCDTLELDPSRASVARLAVTVPAPVAKPVIAAKPKHTPTVALVRDEEDLEDELDDDDDVRTAETEVPGPMRFDMWAAAACAFTVIAFAMATHL